MADLSKLQKRTITQVVSAVLMETRPEEVFLVDNLFDPFVTLSEKTDALGFGSGPEVSLWMYVILEVLKEFASTSAKEFAKIWGERIYSRLWGKHPSQDPLDPVGLKTLRSRMVERMIKSGVSSIQANSVGDCLVATLAQNPKLIRDLIGV